jgi:hypothetical protein
MAHRKQRSDEGRDNIALPDLVMTVSSRVSPPALSGGSMGRYLAVNKFITQSYSASYYSPLLFSVTDYYLLVTIQLVTFMCTCYVNM